MMSPMSTKLHEGPLHVVSTGRLFSFNGEEFKIRFPGEGSALIWSPPWGDMSEEERLAGAYDHAYKNRVSLQYPNVRNFGV